MASDPTDLDALVARLRAKLTTHTRVGFLYKGLWAVLDDLPALLNALDALRAEVRCDACDGSGNALSGLCACHGRGIVGMLESVRESRAQREDDLARVTTERDALRDELQMLRDHDTLPCGHSDEWAYTDDGGEHIICLLCVKADRDALRADLARVTAERDAVRRERDIKALALTPANDEAYRLIDENRELTAQRDAAVAVVEAARTFVAVRDRWKPELLLPEDFMEGVETQATRENTAEEALRAALAAATTGATSTPADAGKEEPRD